MRAANRIDFNSNIPYYIQLVEILKEHIYQSELKPGDQLPGEFELCEQYGISRTVVRQALQELEKKGLIQRRKGKGTFVAPPKIDENLIQKLTGFYQDMTNRGQAPETQVLGFEVIPASPKIAELLHLSTSQNVFSIERLRSVNGVPIVLVTTYIPYHLCPELGNYDLTTQSLYAILEQEFGLYLSHGRRTIEAVSSNQREAELLEIAQGAPLILLDSVTYLAEGTPVEYYHAVHRGDRSRFVVELVRAREEQNLTENINPVNLPESN
ncbi:MAG TPA: GntR family transcriptional regulator [Anaerolineales bacterium]|nr:GntR family transcriptional regulator [Anaerolineales bacterium]